MFADLNAHSGRASALLRNSKNVTQLSGRRVGVGVFEVEFFARRLATTPLRNVKAVPGEVVRADTTQTDRDPMMNAVEECGPDATLGAKRHSRCGVGVNSRSFPVRRPGALLRCRLAGAARVLRLACRLAGWGASRRLGGRKRNLEDVRSSGARRSRLHLLQRLSSYCLGVLGEVGPRDPAQVIRVGFRYFRK